MKKQLTGVTVASVALWLSLLAACDVSTPERATHAPVIKSFRPGSAQIEALAGQDTIRFSITAVDPSGVGLRYTFLLGDSVVSTDRDWAYAVQDTGWIEIHAMVSNASLQSTITWQLTRVQPDNEPPVIIAFQPVEPRPSVIAGSSIEFNLSAVDPDSDPLSFIFTLDDSVVSGSNRLLLNTDDVGVFDVRGIVSDGEHFVAHDWRLLVQPEPDSIPPAPVVLQSIRTGDNPGELVVEWIAVGNDSMDGLPSEYIVKTSSIPIDDEHSWSTGSRRPGIPAPGPPGTTMQMVIGALNPANFVYVAVRAADDFGNLSPLANSLGDDTKGMEVFGTVRDALTGDAVPGIAVRLLGFENMTGADGTFAFPELPAESGTIRVRDEDTPSFFGAYFDIVTEPYQVQHKDTLDFWLVPNITLDTVLYSSFLTFVKGLTRTDDNTPWMPTWPTPFDVYVPSFVHNGIDYEVIVKNAFLQWEDLTGLELFDFVDSIPPFGVFVRFSGALNRDLYEVLDFEPGHQLPLQGRITLRTVYSASGPLTTVATHELGHALGSGHSLDQNHLMIGGRAPRVSAPSMDEIRLFRVMYRIPRGTNMNTYLFD